MKIKNKFDEEERKYIQSYKNTVILWGMYVKQEVVYK